MISSKKKIGIVTLNNSDNYGAVLQCYALSQYLRNNGYLPFLVNYTEEKTDVWRYLIHPIKSLQKLMSMGSPFGAALSRLRSLFLGREVMALRENGFHDIFSHFRAEYLNPTSRAYTHKDLIESCPEAYAFIAGSDAVWAADVYFKKPVYLLDFVPEGIRRISYAASFCKGKIEGYQVGTFATNLSQFDAVSVREPSGVDLVREVAGLEAERVLDPTFLLDDYSAVIDRSLVPDEPYLLSYRLSQDAGLQQQSDEFVSRLSVSLSIEAIEIMPESDSDHTLTPTPEQFLGLLQNASFIVTNSFHGAVFSILFKRKFICIPRDMHEGRKNLRITELLCSAGIDDRFLCRLSDVDRAVEVIETEIAYERVQESLSNFVDQSKKFLLSALR